MEKDTALILQALGLERIPEFVALDGDDQIATRADLADAIEARRAQGAGAFRECIMLGRLKKRLWQRGAFWPLILPAYPKHKTQVQRRLAFYERMRKKLSEEQLYAWAQNAEFPYVSIELGAVVSAVEVLPPELPKGTSPKALATINKLANEKIIEGRVERVQQREAVLDPEEALQDSYNGMVLQIQKAKLKTSAERKAWLERLVGYLMASLGIPGKLTTGQIQPPEGFRKKRGRPRKQRPEPAG